MIYGIFVSTQTYTLTSHAFMQKLAHWFSASTETDDANGETGETPGGGEKRGLSKKVRLH